MMIERMQRWILALGMASLAAACSSYPVVSASGLVRGHDAESVARVESELMRLAPIVSHYMESNRGLPPVRIDKADAPGPTARVEGGYVYLHAGEAERYLAHELIHWYFDEPWNSLPVLIEEGLACIFSWELMGTREWGEQPSRNFAPTLEVLGEVLFLSRLEFYDDEFPEGVDAQRYYEIGVWACEYLGPERVLPMAREASERGEMVDLHALFAELKKGVRDSASLP